MIASVLDSEYVRYLENEYPDYKDRLEDLEQLALFAEQYEELEKFLSETTLNDQLSSGKRGLTPQGSDPGDSEDRLVLSTIHQAKGLEWDAVFVIHMAQGNFPNKRAALEAEGLEEERRLFYVAATRARRELYLSYPLSVGYGDFSYEPKSEFLEELSPHLLEEIRLQESYDDLPTVEIGGDGEKAKPRKGLLRDVDEY